MDSLVDVLTNSMEHISRDEFLDMFEDVIEKSRLKRIWNKYWELPAHIRFFNSTEDWSLFITNIN